MRGLVSAAAIAAFSLASLLGPGVSLAAAAVYTVNSTGDVPDKAVGTGGCETANAGECTLRAAIQESNASAGTKDEIVFSPAFEGQGVADTIFLGSELPAISDPVVINGGTCTTEAGFGGPCVGVGAPSMAFGLVVENADKTTIEGLAVTGALVGIDVIDSSQEFTAVNDWLGVRLDGVAGANATGLFLDPDSDKAIIGVPGEGNVFANDTDEGLDLDGASEATIQGNLFGVAPDGATRTANGKDIEITDSTAAPGFKAVDNLIGGQLTSGQAETAACDGGCNVISGSSLFGIDLKGDGAIQEEAPASGKTLIRGNLIGVNAAGTGVVANFRAGILVGAADAVQVGGPSAELANRINGGEVGIQAGPSAQDLRVEGNSIGLDATGTGSELTPTTEGISVNAEGATSGHQATIAGNRIAMAAGIAIEVEKGGPTGTTIADNVIGRGVGGEHLTAGAVGIRAGGPPGTGNTIEGNLIENAHINGVLLESSNNTVTGNEVLGTDIGSGIVIQNYFFGGQEASGNTIGGDTAAAENVISDSGENAIEIVNAIDTDNHILRNTGSGNADLFIDLGGDGLGNQLGGPNHGIQAPAIGSATPTGVSGSGALPGAELRIFEKATVQNGEIKAFIGEAEADGTGSWTFSYGSPLPNGTEIGVTQTGTEGTSELAQATTAPPPPPGGGQGGGQRVVSGQGVELDTRITKGPKKKSHDRSATFKFKGGPKFECRLDRKPFKPCRSPKGYGGLKPGKHVFKVRSTEAGGSNPDPTPAVKRFTVLG
jgi:CSLREA domain-containing protein